MDRSIEDSLVGDVSRISFPVVEQANFSVDTYRQAYRIHDGKRVRYSRIFIGAVCMPFGAAILYVYLMSRHPIYLVVSLSMFSAGLGALSQSRLRLRNFKRQLKALGKLKEKMDYEISPEGVRVFGSCEEVFRKWEHFIDVKEEGDLILGYLTKNAFQIFPVNEFSPAGRVAVRHFLTVESERFKATE
ncbi:MAG: YcxB family protein [Planctomycetota bacterium]